MALRYQPFDGLENELRSAIPKGRRLGNVGRLERWASAIGGGVVIASGLALAQKRGQLWSGIAIAVGGGALVYRGLTGRCEMYAALGIDTSDEERRGIRIEKTIIIRRSPAELYQFWHKLENLPKFMRHLESVRNLGLGRSHWVAKAPIGTVEWDAEIINERENELIAWQSLEGATIPNAGSVWFTPVQGGTEVKVSLDYNPPAGKLGAVVAKWLGEEPEVQIEDDLRRFKQVMENGAVTTAR
jgi:uncharacterized membrane protein